MDQVCDGGGQTIDEPGDGDRRELDPAKLSALVFGPEW